MPVRLLVAWESGLIACVKRARAVSLQCQSHWNERGNAKLGTTHTKNTHKYDSVEMTLIRALLSLYAEIVAEGKHGKKRYVNITRRIFTDGSSWAAILSAGIVFRDVNSILLLSNR